MINIGLLLLDTPKTQCSEKLIAEILIDDEGNENFVYRPPSIETVTSPNLNLEQGKCINKLLFTFDYLLYVLKLYIIYI